MTQQDLYLVIGIVLIAFSIPAILGALADGRAPRVAAIVVILGGGLLAYAFSQRPYTLDEIPEAFVRVLAHFIR